MIEKNIMLSGIIILFFLVSTTALESCLAEDNPSILYVGGTGENNYVQIQDAIDVASDGDTVFVNSGIYYENIFVDKAIDLIGEDKNSTFIDGGESGNVIDVIVDMVNISGFTIRNSEKNLENASLVYAGIYAKSSFNNFFDCVIIDCHLGVILENSSNTYVNNCMIDSNFGGINFFNSLNCEIINCTILFNDPLFGISFQKTNYSTIFNCNVSSNNAFGLAMSESSNNTIYHNHFYNNFLFGVLVSRTVNFSCRENVLFENNFIDNKVLNVQDNCIDEFWDNGVRGNYWSDFHNESHGAFDNDSDGVADVPYGISPVYIGHVDNFPLMSPVKVGIEESEHDIVIVNVFPQNNDTVEGMVTVMGNAFCEDEEISILSVKVRIDDGAWQLADGTASWQFNFDSTDYENGSHIIYIYALGGEGGYSIMNVTVDIQNDLNKDGNNILPGFEILLVLVGVFTVLFLVKKANKRNL